MVAYSAAATRRESAPPVSETIEGMILDCRYCSDHIVVRDGPGGLAWEWSGAEEVRKRHA